MTLSDESIEGRLIAHRQLLCLLVARLPSSPDAETIWAFLEDGAVFQDHQEDPGAVPSPAHGIQLAQAEELRSICDEARDVAGRR